ncbi:MAG: hypothetical protein J6T24_08965 [Clostridia bacterium]|nr:hypothetical protein [Clostridia bacterium]
MSDPAILTSPDAFSHGLYLDDEKARQGFLEPGAASDTFLSELGYQREPGTLAYRRIGRDGDRMTPFPTPHKKEDASAHGRSSSFFIL